MSIVIDILKTKYGVVSTTKDLIYKKKIIDIHNINQSYEELVKKNKAWVLGVSFGEQKLFLTGDKEESKKMSHIIRTHAILTNKVISIDKEILSARKMVLSETYNSLWIEGVRSSKKKIRQFLKKESTNENEEFGKYIVNYKQAMNFIASTKTISEENLYALYVILSKDIDLGDEKLDGFPYRMEDVEIGGPDNLGIKPEKIKESMDSIFGIIEKAKNDTYPSKTTHIINTVLIHYLFEIVHPYYDMNGRMGRLLSLWYANTHGISHAFLNFSEAINLFKHELYYPGFTKTDINGFKFDPTFFIQSIFFALTGERMVYLLTKNIEEEVKNKFKSNFSELQADILKNIISKENKWYKPQDFILGIEMINQSQVSEALSKLVKWGVLEEINSKPKEYKFAWNEEKTTFLTNLIEQDTN